MNEHHGTPKASFFALYPCPRVEDSRRTPRTLCWHLMPLLSGHESATLQTHGDTLTSTPFSRTRQSLVTSTAPFGTSPTADTTCRCMAETFVMHGEAFARAPHALSRLSCAAFPCVPFRESAGFTRASAVREEAPPRPRWPRDVRRAGQEEIGHHHAAGGEHLLLHERTRRQDCECGAASAALEGSGR